MEIRLGTAKDAETIITRYPYTKQVVFEGGYYIVAASQSDIIGFAFVFRRSIPCPVEAQEDFINAIEVFSPDDRNKGIASLIVDKCKELARENGSYQVRAYCDIGNAASHNLWKKNNFGISPAKDENGSILGSYVTYVL